MVPKERFLYTNASPNQQTPSISSCEDYLLDKVFTFKNGAPPLEKSYYLEAEYYYHVRAEVVTPHACDINVSIIDSRSHPFLIINNRLDFYSEVYYDEQKHGIAYNGNHTFSFSVMTEENLNIYLSIRKGDPVYDEVDDDDDDGFIPGNVTSFYDEETLTFKAWLDSDWSYKFYIKRISTHAANETGGCRLALNVSDPSTLPFRIYSNESNLEPFETVKFNFGTAMSGIYSIHMYVYYESKTVNIAFGIVRDYRITCDDPDLNQTRPSDVGAFSIPRNLLTIVGITVACIIASAAVIAIAHTRKKN